MTSDTTPSVAERLEVRLEAACLACGGPLEVRVDGASAGAYCRACHWISRPSVHRHGQEFVLAHAPAGLA
jgi:hypothetical protein